MIKMVSKPPSKALDNFSWAESFFTLIEIFLYLFITNFC